MTTADALDALLTGDGTETVDDAFSTAALAALDTDEEFPSRAVRALDEAGLPAHYVLSDGAELPETVRLLRAVARRDLTVAIAHGKTFLGTAPVWVAGTAEQITDLAERVRGADAVCWGLTERGHGADLLAGELAAVAEDSGGWRLDGEKWLINNATRAALACVLARTDPAGGARGFSLFLVDRQRLPEGSWRNLPKIRTHGIRGADISGFALDGARVPADALIGGEGDGIPIVLKTLQLTRIAVGALSLGAADHALRLARDFAAGRELYGRRLADIPHIRRVLGRAATSALLAEAVSLLATRSAHTLPGELSVVAPIAKAYVPTVTQETLTTLGELLGVRGFLTSPPGGGFAKLERDHRICAIFDGSTVVNRAALLNQLPRLARQLRRRRADTDGVRAAADLTAPLPPFAPDRLSLLSVTGCGAVQSLPDTVERVRRTGPPELAALTGPLLDELDLLEKESATFVPVAGGLPSTAFDLAERYERAYAAAACLLLWQENPDLRTGPLGAGALWPRACLTALLGADDNAVSDAMAGVLLDWNAPEFTLLGGAA
ncbi:acyl-CoA dehydrogenase family protein [Streptomyces sp. NPDC101112]|uniref:acyl-CoA dehydrogenase family protein n=1 Tax=Streptomyces sp. NPDC101112 TaxID=3366105 RepID=UPI00380E38E0